jgi:Uma2 family endonuclease
MTTNMRFTARGPASGIERVPPTYRIPGLLVFRAESLRRDSAETARNDPYIWAVPELLIECLSPSNRKGSIQALLADYARIAVPEVWLLDPEPPQFTSYRYENGALKQWLTTESGCVTPLLLPNVTGGSGRTMGGLWAMSTPTRLNHLRRFPDDA